MTKRLSHGPRLWYHLLTGDLPKVAFDIALLVGSALVFNALQGK